MEIVFAFAGFFRTVYIGNFCKDIFFITGIRAETLTTVSGTEWLLMYYL